MATNSMHQQLNELQGHLMNFALILTSDSTDARALVQETMLTVQNGEMPLNGHTQIKEWVFDTMRNIFQSNYRNHQATVVDPTASYYDTIADDTVEIPIESVFSTHKIALEICKFTASYRIPYSLYLRGYHFDEIAARSNTSVSMIKSLIIRAQGRLLRKLSV